MIRITIIAFFVFLLSGCSKHVRFLVCPSELSNQLSQERNLGRQREVLFNSDYRIIAVSRDKNGEVQPVQHFRPEHTFGNKIHPLKVTWNEPLTISTPVIVNKNQNNYGVAIMKEKYSLWKIYWFNFDEIKSSSEVGVLFLPGFDELPILKIIQK